MKKQVNVMIILLIVICLICGCGKAKLTGQWYNAKGKCLDIRADKSWKLEGSYGTGRWKYLSDKVTIEFTDFYGDTQESRINKDELGEFIDFGHYGKFYRNAYPPQEKIEEVKAKNAISIDPFEGIKYDVSGISPYCKVTVNNQSCNELAQKYVKYTVQEEYAANGATVTIHAEILPSNTDDTYVLSRENDTYQVNNAPYYIESMDDLSTELLVGELNDYIVANTSFESKYELFGINAVSFLEKCGSSANTYCNFYGVEGVSDEGSYLMVLKEIKRSQFKSKKDGVFNSICVLAKCHAQASHQSSPYDKGSEWYGEGNIYVSFYLNNIVRYPDGHIGFGTSDPDRYDIKGLSSIESVEALKADSVDAMREDYNVTKIENIVFVQ